LTDDILILWLQVFGECVCVCVSGSYLASGSWNGSLNRAERIVGGAQEEIHTSGMSLLLFATGNILCTLFSSRPRSSPSLLRSFRQWGTDGARRGVKAHLVFIHRESERQHEQKANRHEKTERVKKSGCVSWSLSIIVYLSWDLSRL